MKKEPRVSIINYFFGICGMQVCAVSDATDEEILATCNKGNPSGTTGGWSKVIRECIENDLYCVKENLPVTCELNSKRMHFTVIC